MKKAQLAMFGAGCFWGIEAAFKQLKGVTATTVGYSGGRTKNPSYEDVCSDETGHAEVVLVEFDPSKVSYEELLTLFWKIHDPTQVNRQGPDIGSQYRSAIFYNSEEQRKKAEQSKKAAQKLFSSPIATQITKASEFYKAEDYHQDYLGKKGLKTCHF